MFIDNPFLNIEKRLLRRGVVLVTLIGALAAAGCAPSAGATAGNTPQPTAAATENPTGDHVDGELSSEFGEEPEEQTGQTPADKIVAVALAYAWPTEGHGSKPGDATNNYSREIMGELNLPPDDPNTGDDDDPWSDCGVFVAFVMQRSGVDPNYPARETNVQLDYLNSVSNPSDPSRKYEKIQVTSQSQLRPGDILIFSKTYDDRGDTNPANDDKEGHTYLYLGAPGADGKHGTADDIYAAGASWQDNVPERSDVFLTQSGRNNTTHKFTVFRFIA